MSPIVKFFAHTHLPENLQTVSRPIGELAKSLEAKDCFVRAFLPVVAFCCLLSAATAADFPCGAKPSPRHKILAAPQHKPTAPPPAQFARIPAQNSMFGNDQYGCCVTSEEAFSKSCDGVFLSTSVVVDWARQHGFLDGADLVSVMETMALDGFPGASPQHYDDGPYSTVNYGDEPTLQSAIALGNVKIAIDHTALPATAGNEQGWYAIGGGNYPNTDHCVSICAYGPADYLYSQIRVTMPASLAGVSGYLVDTWGTLGFVDHAWLMSAMSGAGEAFVRNPTTIVVPQTPTPAPTRITFAEIVQLVIAALKRDLTPAQSAGVAAFFSDERNTARVSLLESIAYHRAQRAGLIPANTPIESVNWQGLAQFIEALMPLIEQLLPLLLADEHAQLDLTIFALTSAPCGSQGCPLPPARPRSKPSPAARPAPIKMPLRRTLRGSFRGVGG